MKQQHVQNALPSAYRLLRQGSDSHLKRCSYRCFVARALSCVKRRSYRWPGP